MTQAAYDKEYLRLERSLNYNNGKWHYWNDEQYRRPYGSKEYRYALEAVNKWWYRSIDAGNKLAYFERTHAIKRSAA